MDGSAGGRRDRRNDSISSVMSFSADNTTRARQNDDRNAAPATPRDSQRSSHANNAMQYHALDHEGASHMLSQDETAYMDASSMSSGDSDQSSDIMSDQDIRNTLYEMLDQMPDAALIDFVTPYQKATMLPPVTQDSLGELDVARIINNPKLRHDVNFDRELHFRPNLDGSRGKQKLKAADEYWKALHAELALNSEIGGRLVTCQCAEEQEYWFRMMEANQKRIPGIFETIKEVLKTLVPERDQEMINEKLDVPMIMQQLSKGVFDLMELTKWLATLLKAHCAPMRDEWIDQMVEETERGVAQGNLKEIIYGFRHTLAILEAMKLDVANHQIRNLRGLLIDDTINFQQKYHLHKMNYGRMDVTRARVWFKREQSHLAGCNLTPTPLETFTSAVLRSLLSQSPTTQFPDTFHLDAERLRTLRSDLLNIIHLDICCTAFDLLVREKITDQVRETAKTALKSTISDIVGESRRYLDNAENIAAEIVRLVLQLEGSTRKYDSVMIDFVERQLGTDLQLTSSAFGVRLQDMLEAQLPRLSNAMKTSSKLSLIALHDAMLPPVQPTGKRVYQPVQPVQEPPIDEMLKRVTHLAVLHWHIWSPIVYNIQEDGSMSRPGSAGNASGASQMDASEKTHNSHSMTSEAQGKSGGFTNQQSGSSIFNGRPQE